MSVRIMAMVWEMRGLSAPERVVLLALADFSDDKGKCWPSMGSIATMCEMTERGVRKVIRRLEDAGFVTVEHSKGRRSNVYRIASTRNDVPGTRGRVRPEDPEHGAGFNPEPACTNPEPACTQPGTAVPPNHQEPSKEPPEVNNNDSRRDERFVVVPRAGFGPEEMRELCSPVADSPAWSGRSVGEFIDAALEKGWTVADLRRAAIEARESLCGEVMRSPGYLAGVLANWCAHGARTQGIPAKPTPDEGFAARYFERRRNNG